MLERFQLRKAYDTQPPTETPANQVASTRCTQLHAAKTPILPCGLDFCVGMMIPVHEQLTIVDDEAALHPVATLLRAADRKVQALNC